MGSGSSCVACGILWPADGPGSGGGAGEGGGVHDFEILLVLDGGAGGDLVKPLRGVVFEPAEAAKRGEKLVVAGKAGGGDEIAHGEGVDELIVEVLVAQDRVAAGTAPSGQGGTAGAVERTSVSLTGSMQAASATASRRKVSA